MTVMIRGRRCGHLRHCLSLHGQLSGSLTAAGVREPADAGRSYALSASGHLPPLGVVTATGTVHGTGFIYHGVISMRLTLKAPGGTVKISAATGPMPGFTSP
jgi:hypothetical protein